MWKLLPIVLAALLATACQSRSPVSTDYDPAANFGSFHRYAWLEERSGSDKQFDPLLSQRMRDAVGEGLTARAFTPADNTQNADFLVRYYIRADERVEDSAAHGSIGMGSYGGNVGMGVGLSFPLGGRVVEQRAELLIDFVNAKDQKLAWRGSRSLVLRGEDPQQLATQIRGAVEEILGRFPPP